ncbi:hypothetical protein CSPAE12_02882 [Colletotrichum incanum]|nr:hypothetical protein CSPAE12_02882 [Colletotrichum incanum]
MPTEKTFSTPEPDFYKYAHHRENRDRDGQAMHRMSSLVDSIYACQHSGINYASGSWGNTVLRTAYSDESHTLWPVAMDRLKRWVAEYLVHINRLAIEKLDGSVNDELARRFVLEVVETTELQKFGLFNLSAASQVDIKSLVRIFETWRHSAIGTADVDTRKNPRFCDFLVMDEDSLRSLVALPDETPHLGPVSRTERRGVEDGDNYDGWMKLCSDDIYDAWFEKAGKSDSDYWTFERCEIPEGSGIKWYRAR